MEFGSFRFNFDEPSNRFENLRTVLGSKSTNGTNSSVSAATDIQKFFNLFEERQLSSDIFSDIFKIPKFSEIFLEILQKN